MAAVARLAADNTAARACQDRDRARDAAREAAGATGRPAARTRPVGYVRVNADLPRRLWDLLDREVKSRPGVTQSDVIRGALTLTLESKAALARVETYLVERARSLFTR